MKFLKYSFAMLLLTACADNKEDVKPLDDNFPFQFVLEAEEGGDLADAEEYDVEIKLADFLPDMKIPHTVVTLDYSITDLEDDMIGNVFIDKIVYEVETDDCVYERELSFTVDGSGLNGTITVAPDVDLGSIPTSIEIVFTLPGWQDTEGSFKVEFTNLQSEENLVLGSPHVFEYSVLENDVAGSWDMKIETEEEFESFKEIFGPLNHDLKNLEFSDITGKVTAKYEFEEMKFEVELKETEVETICEDGETETEEVNKIIEIEAEYHAEDDEVEWEGSHEIVNDSGLTEDELDFMMVGTYERNDGILVLTFLKVIDEDNFKEGEELFSSENGISFTFKKD